MKVLPCERHLNMYSFSKPTHFESDFKNLEMLKKSSEFYSSDGFFNSQCQAFLKNQTDAKEVFITPSGTAALEMMAQIIEFEPGDEVIVPSYTFSSTAMAFLNAGAKLVFVDVNLSDGCISYDDVIANVTSRTKALLAVSYGGRLKGQSALHLLAQAKGFLYLEDNAQSIGRIGRSKGIEPVAAMSCISFHSTKNITSGGEGGALLINDPSLVQKAWNVRDKGTNRQQFLSGNVSKYQWTTKGGSHILGEPGCAILASQLQYVEKVNGVRQDIFNQYKKHLLPNISEHASLMFDDGISSNGHICAIILKNANFRDHALEMLRGMGVSVVSHYEPLHSSPAATNYGCSVSKSNCIISTRLSKSIIRLPSYVGLTESDIIKITGVLVTVISSVERKK